MKLNHIRERVWARSFLHSGMAASSLRGCLLGEEPLEPFRRLLRVTFQGTLAASVYVQCAIMWTSPYYAFVCYFKQT